MKITRSITPNALDPFSRTVEIVDQKRGASVGDLLPDEWGSADGETLVYLNAAPCTDWNTELRDGDIVSFFGGVTDPVTVALIAISVISAVVSISMIPDIPTITPADSPDGSSAYGYYGFQNSFRAEGDPIPVVYGEMRVAPPVVNQVIAGNSINPVLALSVREDLYCLLAVSEGPIQGLGIYEGVVENQADQDALVGFNSGAAKAGTGLQINGIAGDNFIGHINWRTGTLNQESFTGSSGYITYNDTSVTYDIGLEPTNGQIGDIGDGTYPPGSYSASSSDILRNNDETQYAEQNISYLVDRGIVQILFEKGLYEQNSQGVFQSVTKTIRVQYRETDLAGTGTGNYVLLPAYTVTSSQSVPQVLDIPIDFVDASTYTAPSRQGYYRLHNPTSVFAENRNGTGQLLLQPDNYNNTDQIWTLGMWFSNRDVDGADGRNNWLFTTSSIGAVSLGTTLNGKTWGGVDEESVNTGEGGVSICLRRDIDDAKGQGSDAMWLCVEIWNPVATGVVKEYSVKVGTASQWAAADPPTNNWRHIVVRYYGPTNTVSAIIDGSTVYSLTAATRGGSSSGTFPYWAAGHPWCIGAWDARTDTGYYYTKADVAEMFLYNGMLDPAIINQLGNPLLGLNQWGYKDKGVRAFLEGDENALIILPMAESETVGVSTYYRNYATDHGTATEVSGDFKLAAGTSGVGTTNGPIYESDSGTSKKSYWKVEVFVSEQTTSNTKNDAATVAQLMGLSSQPYSYTSTALASVNIEADEQVNNQQPAMTLLVKGRIVDTWDGAIDADGNPALFPEWSSNPAWIAADLLTHPRYGLGSELGKDAIDWPSFKSWAEFCDEGVPDAFGELNLFGLAAEGAAVDPAEQLIRLYFKISEKIPETWVARNVSTGDSQSSISITAVADAGLFSISDQWVTSNDVEDGLNEASNQLGIYSIEYSDTPISGVDDYVIVKARWNRVDSAGNPIWPSGVSTGDTFFGNSGGTLGQCSGYEPRCRFDGVFDQKGTKAWDAVLQVFTAGRAMPIKAGKKILASVDQPRPVVGVFGQANIITDSLELSYKGPKQSPNSVEGDILDRARNYNQRTVLVDHPSVQDPTLFESFRKERAQFRGVTRASQAMRDATYRLNRYNLVRRYANFSVGPDAVNLLPGDRILVSHDVPQYGFSGRLRGDQVTINTYPHGGAVYASWDREGGPNALSSGALVIDETSISSPIVVSYDPSGIRAHPTTADVAGPAATQSQDGSDASSARTPAWITQFVATGPQLYPPNTSIAPLAQITSASYQCAFSVYVKEPTQAAAEVVRLSIYRLVDADGSTIDQEYVNDFTWASGAITSTHTDTGITGSVASVGSGWYRLGVVYDNSTAGGDVGDYLQARITIGATSGGGTSGTFFPVADGGKGTNFLAWADPLDCTKSEWVTRNTAGSNTIANVVKDPPFYGSSSEHGRVMRIFKDQTHAFGIDSPNISQTHTLTTGTGVANWDNETITVSGYARVGDLNGASNTTLYVDLRFSDAVDSTNKLSGDGVRALFDTAGGPASSWSIGSIFKFEASGTVNSESSTMSIVRQNSLTVDSDWVEFSVSVAYTPSSGSNTAVTFGIYPDSGGAVSGGDTEIYIWGLRVHGKSSSGTTVNPYYHKSMIATAAMFEDGASAINTFSEGSTIQLDRDVTLESGNSYEVLLRSSFAPDVTLNADNSETVVVDPSEVPTSGSTTKAANTALKVGTPARFVAREGDLYSFGKSSQTSEDFVITRISLDPSTLHRRIEAEEYNAAIFDDTAFGTTGTTTVSDLPGPEDSANSSANSGVGFPTTAALGLQDLSVTAVDESVSDQAGGFVPRISIRWRWPRGQRKPHEIRLYIERDLLGQDNRQGAHDPPEYIGSAPTTAGFMNYTGVLLERGVTYRVYAQPVGWLGSSTPVRACPSTAVTVRKVAYPVALAAPSITTATRGWQQLYYLSRIATSRTADIVEGRIGGWKLGQPAFIIDPDTANTASDSTLVGQASTLTGRTGMRVFCRGRSSQGHYGQATIVTGTEQLDDVLYDHSISAENGWPGAGAYPVSLIVAPTGELHFNPASSDLSASYTPTAINLGSVPQRVLVNCVPEAIQIRPETLGDLTHTLGSEKLRRWSFEGPMDDLDGGDCTLTVEWRWSSTASASSKSWREFRPGEVYARTIEFRVTLTRPTSDYDIYMERLVVQALLPPNFAPADVDGGTFA